MSYTHLFISHNQSILMVRNSRAAFKIYGNVFDNFTETCIHKMISKGILDKLESPIFVGKESNVFTGFKGSERIILKIYRLENCNFNKMYNLIRFDRRYLSLRNNRRKVIFAWAQREYRNLLMAREAGVAVPTAYAFSNHILLLSLIGDSEPAPQVKNLYPKDPENFYRLVIENMKKLVKANLIHGDLSQYNILNHNESPVFIDFSQSTTLENPYGREYLERDIYNICTFFEKLGVVCDKKKVFEIMLKARIQK